MTVEKESCISSIYLITPLVTQNFKLSKALTILFNLVRILTKEFLVDSLTFHAKWTQREGPASLLAWPQRLKPALPSSKHRCSRRFHSQPKSAGPAQGQNSSRTCQHAGMFGMFSHTHWKACGPTSKKMKVSYCFEIHFQEIKTVNQRNTLKLGKQICKILLF